MDDHVVNVLCTSSNRAEFFLSLYTVKVRVSMCRRVKVGFSMLAVEAGCPYCNRRIVLNGLDE